ncbi:fluoride efflux transporter FluC [Streptomyces koyangensis]|uniref:fluoride efflux transporter FluC n=1 Tax=Streptomyces koyangensis TaxID=188770 RepID=UPI003BF48537
MGAPVRYWIGMWLKPSHERPFPWGTFDVNAVASLLLGIAVLTRLPQAWVQSLAAVGFCGAMSTWSTPAYESADLATMGRQVLAAGYVAAIVGAGLGLAYAGSLIGRTDGRAVW